MNQQNLIIGAIIFILFVLFWMMSSSYYSMYDDMISGMWKADPEWAEQADIDGMLLFIGPSEGGLFSETRKGYLVMHADDQIIASKKIDLNISTGITLLPKTTVIYGVTIVDLEESDDGLQESDYLPWKDIMPYKMDMELGVSNGKLILSGDEDGEKIQYAQLFKDPAATDLSRVMKATE